jgi:hypothetical protein
MKDAAGNPSNETKKMLPTPTDPRGLVLRAIVDHYHCSKKGET